MVLMTVYPVTSHITGPGLQLCRTQSMDTSCSVHAKRHYIYLFTYTWLPQIYTTVQSVQHRQYKKDFSQYFFTVDKIS